jgi:GMP synthase-like glutamine amidotransferase
MKTMILIVKHIDIEGPGTLGDFLIRKSEPFRVVELGAGEKFSKDLKGIKAVVVLGGPMNVYEEDKYPFLKDENIFIQRILKAEIPYFGICLGSQLLAKAAGARVVRSPVKEIGWYRIALTPDGKSDPFFQGFREDEDIYHWHGDMFEIPQDGALLASGTGCPHQAFRVGKNAYGIQFHVEVTDRSIKEWCDEYSATDLPGRKEHCAVMLDGYFKKKEQFNLQANRLYENFLAISQ